MFRFAPTLILLFCAAGAEAQVVLTKGTNFSADIAADGRITFDVMGKIWAMSAKGGEATMLYASTEPARRPRWSPDGRGIVFEKQTASGTELWLYRLDENSAEFIGDEHFLDRHPDWHPDGHRITYSTDRRDTGFDLWELHLETRLAWRISHRAGDESDPAWSADGRDLVYVHHHAGSWSLMLRRHGQTDRTLVSSDERISSPAWRPDSSLVTFLRHGESGYSIDMVILSDPLLVRPLVTGEDFFDAAVSWADRQHLIYTANGNIRTRQFNSWTPRNLPFRALMQRESSRKRQAPPQRRLPAVEEPDGRLVIRTARLFDGIGGGYREALDIVIDGGRISAVESRRERPGAIVIDLGDLTTLPGFVDGAALLPGDVDASLGPSLLSLGVTTIVTDSTSAQKLNALWSGESMPGPRVLGGDWQLDLDSLASIVSGADSTQVSPAGIRYENAQITNGKEPAPVLSGLADSRTRGLEALLKTRQADLLGRSATAVRRFVEKPQLDALAPLLVIGSESNGLPPGIALHAEFLALEEAGVDNEKVLHAAGINAASALGLGLRLGRIAPGASADLVIVDGDPLKNIADAGNVVGIVRNGRFFSTIGLIERVENSKTVE